MKKYPHRFKKASMPSITPSIIFFPIEHMLSIITLGSAFLTALITLVRVPMPTAAEF